MKRVGNAFKGILGGFVFILIGIVLLWWNEGNNVRNIKTTAEMDKIVVDVPSDKVDSANEGKLVATHGKVINEEEMFDETFNVKVQTPIMKRVVEVYQWDEDSDTDEDGHTTYSYKKVWDTDIIDSGEDIETDDALRERYLEWVTAPEFGGNISDYQVKVKSLTGVGGCKVIPVWDGGGTVKLIITNSTYGVPDESLVDYVQEQVDPTGDQTGLGIAPIGHVVTVVGAEQASLTDFFVK